MLGARWTCLELRLMLLSVRNVAKGEMSRRLLATTGEEERREEEVRVVAIQI